MQRDCSKVPQAPGGSLSGCSLGGAAVYLSVSTSAETMRDNATPPTEAQMAALRERAERRAAEDVMGSFASRESREKGIALRRSVATTACTVTRGCGAARVTQS